MVVYKGMEVDQFLPVNRQQAKARAEERFRLDHAFHVYIARLFFFTSRRRHTRYWRDWSPDVCSSDLEDSPVRPPRSAYSRPLPSRERTNRTVFPSREKTGDSSACCAGGDVHRRCDPSSPMRQSAQCVWKKPALLLSRWVCTTSERSSGAHANAPQDRPGAGTSARGRQSGGPATSSCLRWTATRSLPAVKTSRPPHQAM